MPAVVFVAGDVMSADDPRRALVVDRLLYWASYAPMSALSEFAGKGSYVLMDFWASWCGPCMQAIPNLRAFKEKYASKGLKLVGVNVWDSSLEKGVACAKDKEMDCDIIFTSDNKAAETYGVDGIPTLILIAPDGTIVERLLGEEGLEEALARHLD